MHIFIFCLKHRSALPNLKLWKKKKKPNKRKATPNTSTRNDFLF